MSRKTTSNNSLQIYQHFAVWIFLESIATHRYPEPGPPPVKTNENRDANMIVLTFHSFMQSRGYNEDVLSHEVCGLFTGADKKRREKLSEHDAVKTDDRPVKRRRKITASCQ